MDSGTKFLTFTSIIILFVLVQAFLIVGEQKKADTPGKAAIEFAQAFYGALTYGKPVDEAIVEARKAISLAVANTVEWGTPVLFLRAEHGRLFDIDPESGAGDQRFDQLAESYDRGLEHIAAEEWSEAEIVFVSIAEQEPGYVDTDRLLAQVRARIVDTRADDTADPAPPPSGDDSGRQPFAPLVLIAFLLVAIAIVLIAVFSGATTP